MFAEGGDVFHIEFVERDDAIDGMGSGRITDGINQALQGKLFGHGEDFIDAFERPRSVAKVFEGQGQDKAAQRFAGADEFLALFVGTDAENGERPAFRHATPPRSSRLERGLYSGLARGIKKLQKWADALRPSRFVVLRAFNDFVMQIVSEFPAFFEQHIAKFFDLRDDARTFAGANIQPDARARLDHRSTRKAVNHLLGPPDGRGEGGHFSENARMLESTVKRNQAARRGPAGPG